MSSDVDVAIVGAGPYGLAAAAHIRSRSRVGVHVFGEPMSFWQERMPSAMLLRSPYPACSIGAPERMSFDDWRRQSGVPLEIPVPLARFVEYGRWFQEKVAPDVDRREVAEIASANGSGYTLRTPDGDELVARRVVVAAGIGGFAHVPGVFHGLPESVVGHASRVTDFAPFAGKRVVVVGGGQSAIESAALLHEAGASVELIARESSVRFLSMRIHHELGAISRLMYAWPDVGPAGISHLVARPTLWRRLPRKVQDRLGPRCIRPAGAGWLVTRTRNVTFTTRRSIVQATADDGLVRLLLDDGSERVADFVLLGTGYRVDIGRYGFIRDSVLSRIRRHDGYPILSRLFETSSEGVYIVGAPAAWSFGPLMRFVAGSDFAARRVAVAIRGV